MEAPAEEAKQEVFISWRYGVSLGIGARSGTRLLWLQDLVGAESLPPPGHLPPRSVLVLSEFHRTFLQAELHKRAEYSMLEAGELQVVLPNGIDMRYRREMDGPNDNLRFVYGSSPVRGLEQVLRVWPSIRRSLPGASLHIYYGFPPHVTEQLSKSMGAETFLAFRKKIMEQMEQEGVEYMGSVDHSTLTRAYAAAGFLLYPTNYPETGCITVQKAMCSGAIPITSRFSTSVLPHLTHGYDLGPQVCQFELQRTTVLYHG